MRATILKVIQSTSRGVRSYAEPLAVGVSAHPNRKRLSPRRPYVAFRPLGLLLVALLVVASACASSHRRDEPWTVQSISPDGRTIVLGVSGGDCDHHQQVLMAADSSRVTIQVRYTSDSPCDKVLIVHRVVVQLESPLGPRQLSGCLSESASCPLPR
jgi:hypothetical protein